MQRLDNTNLFITRRQCLAQFGKCNLRPESKAVCIKFVEGKAHQKVLQMAKNILPFFRAFFAASRSKLFTIKY